MKATNKKKTNLVARLDRVFSQYIRLRDMQQGRVFRCISCNRLLPIREADCGHYINRKHMATRFSEDNCNAQCRACNRFDEGNIQGYRRGLVAKIGETRVQLLEMQKNSTRKYMPFELEALIQHYKKEIAQLLATHNASISCLTE